MVRKQIETKENWSPASSKRDFERIVDVFIWTRCHARNSKVPGMSLPGAARM